MRPTTDPETRARLKAEILQHLATGATMRAVAALPGLPPWSRIRSWRARDAAFDADVALALRRGGHQRFAAFDETLARAVLIRYAAGEALKAIAADPALPSLERIDRWRLTQPEFGAEILRLKAVHAEGRRQTHALRRMQPRPFDQGVADRILVRVVRGEKLRALLCGDPDLPGVDTIKRWRREQPVFDRELATAWRSGVRRRHRAQRRERYASLLALKISMGATLTSLGRRPDMPSTDTLSRWLNEDPEFAQAVHTACSLREMRLNDQILDAWRALPPTPLTRIKSLLAPMTRQESRLRNWPARKHRRGW